MSESRWKPFAEGEVPPQPKVCAIPVRVYEPEYVRIKEEAGKHGDRPSVYCSGIIRRIFGVFGSVRVGFDLELTKEEVDAIKERLGSRPLQSVVYALVRAWCGLPETENELLAVRVKSEARKQRNLRTRPEDDVIWNDVAKYRDLSVSEAVRQVMLEEWESLPADAQSKGHGLPVKGVK